MKLLEVHIIQTVAPCNLNRDDTGSPKDAMFGGYRRARISSQCQKRAVRLTFKELLQPDDRAVRTRRLVSELCERLENLGHSEEEARRIVEAALNAVGFGIKGDLTEYLLFLGKREIDQLASQIHENFEFFRGQDSKGKKKAEIPEELRRSLDKVFDGGKAVDLALFGRMLADRPELGMDAACQVAHAISTHKVDREFDFYTAVDDLAPREETGAGMMGDIEFYSATFYRYALIDLAKLLENLQGDLDLARRGACAFLRAFVITLPSGKQNSFAAHNLPQFVAIRAGVGGPRNLATAFERPVTVRDGKTLAGLSVERLLAEWEKFDRAYGTLEQEHVGILNLSDGELFPPFSEYLCADLDSLLQVAEESIKELLGG